MRFTQTSGVSALLVLQASARPSKNTPAQSLLQVAGEDRAGAIKEAFQFSWDNYYKTAFPHDVLHPVSGGYDDGRNGWGATPVDALSTAALMQDKDIVNQILEYIPTIDFNTTANENEGVSVFESTIRYLGGLVSAYDLLTGPFKDLVDDESQVDSLLSQAESLADSLKVAFDTPSGVPDGTVILNPEKRIGGSESNSIVGIGTLILEWTRLSDLTGKQEYADLAQNAQKYILKPQPASAEPFPGLLGTEVSIETGELLDDRGGWGASDDSFYEYLIKMYLYDPELFSEYKDRWVLAVDSTMKYLASHPTSREDLTFISGFSGTTLRSQSGHLDSFCGGNFILGGILLDKPEYTEFGINVTESFFNTYQETATGIGPEGFAWSPSEDPDSSTPPSDQQGFYEEAGFWVTSSGYILRPETLESVYYAYRVTGDTKYQDWAWEAFKNINASCRTDGGYSGIRDVNAEDGGGLDDRQQSFWLAEVLKYLYLIFVEDSPVHVRADGNIGYVFNTEAHPVKVKGYSG